MARLDKRVALLTGGAKGIGRHYAKKLASEGARLMIADIADGQDLAGEIAREHGANSVASAIADVSDEGAVKKLVADTVDRFGKIDILVNNAALFAPLKEQKVLDIDVALWDRVMAINIRGVFLMTKHVAPAHDRAEIRQDHQYQLGHRRPRHTEFFALRDVKRRGDGVHTLDFARARRV